MYCFIDKHNNIISIFENLTGLTELAKESVKELTVRDIKLRDINIYINKDTIEIYKIPERYIDPLFNFSKKIWIENATQENLFLARKEIESKMSALNIDIKSREELRLSTDDENLKMTEFRKKLDYINSKILIKL